MATKLCTLSPGFRPGELQASHVSASDFKSAPVFQEIENELNQVIKDLQNYLAQMGCYHLRFYCVSCTIPEPGIHGQ